PCLAWQAALDRPDGVSPWPPPAPRPPLAARPRVLSVTQIESWMRDPYAIYARHILKLHALEPIDAEPGAADRGSLIHQALDRFASAYADRLPADALERLLEIGRECFGTALARPAVWAFWWPRFERIARWFVAVEAGRREGIIACRAEVEGSLTVPAPGGPFT